MGTKPTQPRGAARPDWDVVVVGAGVVGLACAAALARAGRSVLILEAEDGIARGATSRNSEVIHAGIYYPRNSLKARMCTEGRELLYERCAAHGIPHRRLGKLIVATAEAEVETVEDLCEAARGNGVPGIELIDAAEIRRLEPDVRAVAALRSPETGIVDAHALSLSFLAEAEAHEAVLLLCCRVEAIESSGSGWRVRGRTADGQLESVDCAALVNAAGLASDRMAELAGMDVEERGYRLHPCKGDYFSLAPGSRLGLSRLVYPVPVKAGLGIHATLDLAGRVRFGPDTEYVSKPVYEVDPAKAVQFVEAARRYLPGLEDGALAPDYAGVRAKLAGPGEGFRDFVIAEEPAAGFPGLVNCIGIESAGLTASPTASPAIARHVAELLAGL
jgi:L-2-hydroxyglutarate oxidase LhgO